MKRRDLERHLREHGCRKLGEGANHTKWRSAEGRRRSAVPRHREVAPNLALAICNQLGVPQPPSVG